MRDLLNQIERGLNYNLYYLCLYVALAIPDICGSLESDDGIATGEKYKKWFDEYLATKYGGFLTGEDCYLFRCSLLHQGSSCNPNSSYSRVLFVELTNRNLILHNNILNDALNIDVNIFCKDIIEGANKWLIKNENMDNYKKNSDKFMERHSQGLAPYIVGVPVIG